MMTPKACGKTEAVAFQNLQGLSSWLNFSLTSCLNFDGHCYGAFISSLLKNL